MMKHQLYWLLIILAGLGDVLLQVCDMSDNRYYNRTDFHDSNEHWINPSRGFYHTSLTYSNSQDFQPLIESQLDCWRNRDGVILLLREYVLDDYVNGTPLSRTFLNQIEYDLTLLRHAGWNVILRFMYNKDTDLVYMFHEPAVSDMVDHIKQLQGVLWRHEAIILAVQAGFLGEYGVWYEPGQQSGTNEPLIESQRKILEALLKVVPPSIQIQVPKPKYKQSYLTPDPTTLLDVINPSQSTIGHYHECLVQDGQANHFVDAYTDLEQDPTVLNYLVNDTKFTLMGGKTCNPGVGGLTKNYCARAETLFEKVHMSYLDGYDNGLMLQNFKQNGCFGTLFDKLGYQYLLQFAILPHQAEVGSDMCIQVAFSNRGYAATYRNFDVDIVFILHSDAHKTTIVSQTRIWVPSHKAFVGDQHIIHLNSNMPTGVYKVYLRIVDPLLSNDSDYYVLIASNDSNNNSVAIPSLGLNLLGEVEVKQPQGPLHSNPYVGSTVKHLTRISLPAVNNRNRKYVDGVKTGCVQLPGKPTQAPLNFTAYMTCKKVEFVKALLEDNKFNDSKSSMCADQNRYSSEAVLQRFCNATPAFQWHPVPGKIIDICNKIQPYTPIAQFNSKNQFNPSNDISGVFLGCATSLLGTPGVKIGYQTCTKRLDVRFLVTGGSLDNMHIVTWN